MRDGVKQVEVFAYSDTTPPTAFVSVTAATYEHALGIWHRVSDLVHAQLAERRWW